MYWSENTTTGLALVEIGIILFLGFCSAAILSEFLPPCQKNQILAAIQNDRYYYLLIPLTMAIIIVAVYLHWLSMKLFKHA